MALTTEEQERLDYLKHWVTARVDELMPSGSSTDGPIGLLEPELDEAARWVLLNARKELVYQAAKDGSDLDTTQKNDKTLIHLPEKYIRFIRLKMTGWNRAIDSLISVDSDQYRHQQNQFNRGRKERPVAAIVAHIKGESKRAIECYPKDVSIEEFVFTPRLSSYEMPKDLSEAMVWNAVARTLQILGRGEQAGQANGNAVASLDRLLLGMHGEKIQQTEASR